MPIFVHRFSFRCIEPLKKAMQPLETSEAAARKQISLPFCTQLKRTGEKS